MSGIVAPAALAKLPLGRPPVPDNLMLPRLDDREWLHLEEFDGTIIEVIARIYDLHLALMFKMRDDLAAR